MKSQGNARRIELRIYRGEALERTVELSQDVIKLGRLASSHVRLEDDDVSRMHAVIEAGAESVHIIDLGSASGTFVNGKRVNKATLEDGDELTLGGLRLVISVAPRVVADIPKAVALPPTPPALVPNPFAKPAPLAPAPTSEEVRYGVVASGPPVASEEVETTEAAVEVVVTWGDSSVLHVEHMCPPREFWVGEASKETPVDYLVGADALGGIERLPVVIVEDGAPSVVIPAGSEGSIEIDGQLQSFDEMAAAGALKACGYAPGAQSYALPDGATARVHLGSFRFTIRPVQAGKKIHGGGRVEWRPFGYIGGSIAIHALVLILFQLMPPKASAISLQLLNEDGRMIQALITPPAVDQEEPPEWVEANDEAAGGEGERHDGEEGEMGDEESPQTNNRYAIEGPRDNEDRHMAREEAREMARTAGILGTLANISGSWNAPTSPYGAETAIGSDPMSALGALMGDQLGQNSGFHGLGLRGTGRGAGGDGRGTIGLGTFGTLGHGGGEGDGNGYGDNGGNGLRQHRARTPILRGGTVTANGGLSREAIRRVVRRHLNEVRFCYEQALQSRPDIEGRVAVRFFIAPSGAVQAAVVGQSTVGNQRVEHCIVNSVRRWTFPQPDNGGVVSVTYPFLLTSPNN